MVGGALTTRPRAAPLSPAQPLPLLTFNETLVVLTTIQSTFTQLTNYTVSVRPDPCQLTPALSAARCGVAWTPARFASSPHTAVPTKCSTNRISTKRARGPGRQA